MSILLGLVTFLAYLFGLFAVLVAGKTDVQIILGGVYFTCGTVALSALAIINALEHIKRRLPEPPPAALDTSSP